MSKTTKKKEKKIPGPPCGYTDIIDAAMTQDAIDNKWAKSFPLRPSASGYCGRRLALDLSEFAGHAEYPKEEREPRVNRLLGLGNTIEYASIRDWKKIKSLTLKHKQQSVIMFKLDKLKEDEQERLIEGSNDFAVYSPKYKAVVDIKSQKDAFSFVFRTRWEETLAQFDRMETFQRIGDSETAFYIEDLPAALKELGSDWLCDNLIQLNMYCMSDFFVKQGVDHGVIYKYNKNDSRHYEIRIKPSKAVFDAVEKKFNHIYKSVVKNKDPSKVKKDFFLGSMRCSNCPYSQVCWDEDAKKSYFKTLPKKQWPTDSNRLKNYKHLEAEFKKYLTLGENLGIMRVTADEIIKTMHNEKISKIKLDNGDIYELKYLKTPTPHYELRKGKL